MQTAPDAQRKLSEAELIPATQRALQAAYAYDMSRVLKRFMRDYKVLEFEASRYERELKRYLTLCAFSRRGYSTMGRLDDLWHTFLLFTTSYKEFCETCVRQQRIVNLRNRGYDQHVGLAGAQLRRLLVRSRFRQGSADFPL